jgi:hypothetical protein
MGEIRQADYAAGDVIDSMVFVQRDLWAWALTTFFARAFRRWQ